jgi:hypothetical protein
MRSATVTYRWPTTAVTAVHVTRSASVDSILRHGLRPASWWVDRAVGIDQGQREHLLSRPRAEASWLRTVDGDQVWLRDQQPLLRGRLGERLVAGTSPEEFLRLLNEHVYLCPSPARAAHLLRVYRPLGPQTMLHLDRRRLLDAVGDRTSYTTTNPGAIGRRRDAYKGPHQFVPARTWVGRQPAEIAVVSPGIEPEVLRDCLLDIFEEVAE